MMAQSTTKFDDSAPEKPKRRSPGVIRALIIDAARDLFCSQGYANTSTRIIAERAGVSETHLFRHFGTKANLFEKAIFDPLADFINEFTAKWDPSSSSYERNTEDYITGLYDVLRHHRELAFAVMTTQAYEINRTDLDTKESPLSAILDHITDMLAANSPDELEDIDPLVAPRLIFSVVFGMAALEYWLFSTSTQPTQARIIQQIKSLLVHGIGFHGMDFPGLGVGGESATVATSKSTNGTSTRRKGTQ